MSALKFDRIRRALFRWFRQNQRDLPWRQTKDPYSIWIAETMLQQTQVKTVLPYYRRFLEALPRIESLDHASKERVLALWSGLGYYRRAENLKKSVRRIMQEYGGKIPQTFAALYKLPGVGPYTAGALMSIAFNQPYPALDGNAKRVLTRIFNVKREKDLWDIGKRLAPSFQPGHFNQALMELGSRICLPRAPSCTICPVKTFCLARRSMSFTSGIRPMANRGIRKVQWPLLVIQDRRMILLRRRAQDSILRNLWEVPGGERKDGETLKAALLRHLNGLGNALRTDSYIGEVRHSITYRRIQAPVFLCSRVKRGRLRKKGWRWFPLSALHKHPLSSLSLKAIRLVAQR